MRWVSNRMAAIALSCAGLALMSEPALARRGSNSILSITPYASTSSNKSIKPGEVGKENSKTKQRTTYGLRINLNLLYDIIRIQTEVGQNKLETTEKTREAQDDFNDVDFEEDLNMSVDDPEQEVKVTETQQKARFGVVFDPSIGPIIIRAKTGVSAKRRILTLEQGDADPESTTVTKYNPFATAGAGIKFSRRTYFVAEYTWDFYAFPDMKPFEREVSVAFGLSI